MNRFVAIIQLIAAALFAVMSAACLVNIIFITTRPETISVVNAMIGLGVLVIAFFAMARIFARRGLRRWREANADEQAL